MPSLTEFYLEGDRSTALIETYEISHPAFSQVYRYVRNDGRGGTFTLEDGTQEFFEFYPLEATRIPVNDNLDATLAVSLGDVNDIIANEIDNLRNSTAMLERPKLIYRSYASNDYTTILDGPFILDIVAAERRTGQSQLDAEVPRLNDLRTGERYTVSRFPMILGGF